MVKNTVIGVMLVTIIVLAASLARVENLRYALTIGMRASPQADLPRGMVCILKRETPTSWLAGLLRDTRLIGILTLSIRKL